ncbi:hypothetical protein ACP275_13G068500 [Erythranthe tilingii]
MLQHPLSIRLIPPKWQSRGYPSPKLPIIPRRLSSVKLSTTMNNYNTFASTNNISGGKGMNWFHEIKLEVRDYEVDRYIWSGQCELSKNKIGLDGDVFAVTEMSLKCFALLRSGDRFSLKVKLYDYSATRFYFESLIFKLPNIKPILEAKSIVVCLDENYRPTRISQEMISKFNQFLVHEMRVKKKTKLFDP